MKFLSLISLFAILAASTPVARAQATPPATPAPTVQTVKEPLIFGLQDGTPVRLRLSRNLSSADAKTGETIDFEVLEDIKVGELVVIPRGSVALGTVTRAKPKGRLAKGGKLDITIDSVRTITGEKIALRAVKETKGKALTGTMTGAMVASGILFFPVAPLFLFLKGKDVKIPKGTEVTAYINGDAALDRSKFMAAEERAEFALVPSTVTVTSLPEGAEILINGKFVGSTPSTLKLEPGDHTISIKLAGFVLWERTISSTAGGSVTVNATLEKSPEK